MESNSSVLRKKIMNVMNDGVERDISDIKQAIASQEAFTYGVDYTEGTLAGCLRVLKNKGKLQLTGRGVYKLSPVAIYGTKDAGTCNPNAGVINEQSLSLIKCQISAGLVQQYQYLVKQLDEVTLASLSELSDLNDVKYLLALKNNLKNFLTENHII